jgi:hypothetical protein
MNKYTRATVFTLGSIVGTIGGMMLAAAVADGVNWAVTGTARFHDSVALGLIGFCVLCVGAMALTAAIEEL